MPHKGPTLPTGTIRVRRHRRQTPTKFRLHKAQWVDPYPGIAGTDPEKRIFAALMAKHIYFIFQGQVPELEKGSATDNAHSLRREFNKTTAADRKSIEAERKKQLEAAKHPIPSLVAKRPVTLTLGLIEFIPDFVLPEYKVILDPFSPFHHSQPDSVIRDTRKVALYNALGYEYYHFWAVAPGVFVLDEYVHLLGRWRGTKYLGRRAAPPVKHARVFGAVELLDSLPLIMAGPRFPLIDQRDITAKRTTGYRIGEHLGAGATGVALANAKRRRPPRLTLKR